MGFLEKIFGNYSEKEIKKIKPIVTKIEALGPQYESLSDEELRAKTQEFKEKLAEKTGTAKGTERSIYNRRDRYGRHYRSGTCQKR